MYNITHPWPLYVRSVPQKYHSWELKPCLLRFWTLKLHPQGNGLVILDTLHNQRNNPVPDQNHMGQQKQILERGYEWVPSHHSPTSWSPFQREVDLRSLVGSAHNSPLRWLIRCQTLSECPPDLERCSRRLPPSLLCPTPAQRLHKTTNHERKAAACMHIHLRGQSRACGGNAPINYWRPFTRWQHAVLMKEPRLCFCARAAEVMCTLFSPLP